MRPWWILLVCAACQREPGAELRASCKPNSALDGLECVVENVGKKRARACVTAREQVPKAQPLVARRMCTGMLEPGQQVTLRPTFDRYESLQPVCSPEGVWICKDEIVETPEMLTENIPGEK